MVRAYIDLPLVVDSYLQGHLSDTEEAEFEARLTWDQALVEESEGYSSYRVSIEGEGATAGISWSAEGITPTYPQSLAISLPPGFLHAGDYVLTVEGELANATGTTIYEHVRDIPFEVEIVP